MENTQILSSVSYVDFIIAGSFLLFIIIGVVRGFTNDILSLLTWLGAIASTKAFFPLAQPYIRNYISEPFFADIVLGFIIFVLSLILLVFLAKKISGLVRQSVLSGLDRTLGIISGSFRAVVLLIGLYWGTLMFYQPGKTPYAMQTAKLLPVVNAVAKSAHSYLIPHDFFPKRLLNHMYGKAKLVKEKRSPEDLVKSLSSPKAGPNKTKIKKKKVVGYKSLERQALETLIDQIAPKE